MELSIGVFKGTITSQLCVVSIETILCIFELKLLTKVQVLKFNYFI